MSALKVTVPITLSRDNDGFWLHVEAQNGNAAAISLANLSKGSLIGSVFNTWASEKMAAAMKSRRKTGLNDVTSTPVLEGDIVERFDWPGFYEVYGVVKWDAELAAFVIQGARPDGTLWQSDNLRQVRGTRIVGNVFENNDLLKPCREVA